MNITDIRIRRTYSENRLRALVSVTVDHDLAVHDIKIIEGSDRLFVAMPSRKDEAGNFRDICHPISLEARKNLEESIIAAYESYKAETGEPNGDAQPAGGDSDAPLAYDTPDAGPGEQL